jgi:hypothetical protein
LGSENSDNKNHKDHIFLSNGKGLYSDLPMNNNKNNNTSFNLSFLADNNSNNGNNNAKDNPVAMVMANDGRTFRVENVSSINLMNERPIHVYARQPVVNVDNGNTIFRELYLGQVSGKDFEIF